MSHGSARLVRRWGRGSMLRSGRAVRRDRGVKVAGRRSPVVLGVVGLLTWGMAGVGPGAPASASTAPLATAAMTGTGFTSVTPARLLDTRTGIGAAAAGPVGPAGTVDVQVAGRGGIPASGVSAVVVNLTAVAPNRATYVSLYPTGAARPNASNINLVAGQTRANTAIVALGTGGRITLYNYAGSTDLLVDVSAWIGSGSAYRGQSPQRILDTRIGLGAAKAAAGPGRTVWLQVTGRGGVPASGVSAVALNLTGIAGTTATYLTAYPAGVTRPVASNLNLAARQTAAVFVMATLGTGGRIGLYNNTGSTELIADVAGWYSTGGEYTPVTPTRLLDTRTTFGAIPPGGEVYLNVGSAPGLPAGAGAAVLSVTAVNARAQTYLTVYPAGTARPATSNLNAAPGETVPNLVIAQLDAFGRATVYNNAGANDVVVDLQGWIATNPALEMPSSTAGPIPVGEVGVAYTLAPPPTTGGRTPFTWTLAGGTLPAGLAVDPATGAVTGTPTADGTTTITRRVTDATGEYAEGSLSLRVFPHVTHGVWAWGVNSSGQLGDGSPTYNSGPVQVSGLSDVAAVAAGPQTGYAVKTDGTVWAWGNGINGQLGNGAAGSPTPVRVGTLTGVTAVAAGAQFATALKSDGTVWAWGYNTDGQLGTGTKTSSSVPVQVSNLTGVTAIADGARTGYALTSDGTVWAWGDGLKGDLGNGTTTSSRTPVRVTGLTGITAIAGGLDNGYALKSDGTVWSWGPGTNGQLGNGSRANVSSPVQVIGVTTATSIAANVQGGYALLADGTVRAWGLAGALGNGSTTSVPTATPVQVSALTGVTRIAGGARTGLALKSDGSIWGWGDGTRGQLGGVGAMFGTPVRDTLVPPVSALIGGALSDTVYAITID